MRAEAEAAVFSKRGLGWVVAGCVAVYVAAAWCLSGPQAFWSVDSSVRYVQLESIRRQGYRTLAVVYPAGELDPDGRFYPIAEGFSYRRDGRTYLSYSWVLPAASAPFVAVLGFPGLLVIPVAGALAAGWVVGRAASRTAPEAGQWAMALLLLASPLLVYGVLFWDHAPLAALAAGAVASLCGQGWGWAWLGGFLLGLGPWLRNEAYVLAAAALLAVLLTGGVQRWRKALAVCCGVALPLGGLWVYNLLTFGHVLGYKGRMATQALSAGGLWGYLTGRATVVYDLLLSLEHYARATAPERVVESAVIGLAAVAAARLVRAGTDRGSTGLFLAGGLLAAAVAVVLAVLRLPVMGLLPSVPFVALAVATAPDAEDRFLWAVTGLYVAGVAVSGTVGGAQWGPRYLLPIVPVLAWLSAKAAVRAGTGWPQLRRAVRVSLAAVLAGGVLLQLSGLGLVRHSVLSARAVEDVLRSAPTEVVATGFEPLTRLVGRLYFEKKLMAVDSQEELRELVLALSKARVPGWTYVPRFGPGFDAELVTRWTQDLPWRFRVQSDRTPLVVEFGGIRPIRLVTYRGVPATPSGPAR